MTIALREFNPNMKPLSDEGRKLLIRARARLSDPVRWTQYCIARNSKNEEVSAEDVEATCWCAFGALIAEDPTNDSLNDRVSEFLEDVARTQKLTTYIGDINDAPETTHEDILLWLDTALEYDAKLKEGL